MFALPHNPALRKQILNRVWNEYRYAKNELEDLLASEELSEQKIRLYLSLMKSCSWYQLLAILTEKELQQALSIKVITKLWPNSLQKRFPHAARILYPLQDKVLKILERAEGEFYLSLGTALSR